MSAGSSPAALARRFVVLACALCAAFGAPAAPAVASTPTPQRVHAASLTQDGQQLVWAVQLAAPFSPTAMRKARQDLCLIIRRASNSTVAGQLCLAPPARGSTSPRLIYQRVTSHGAGPGSVIAASIRRTSTDNLRARFLPADIRVGYNPLRWSVLTGLFRRGCRPLVRGSGDHCDVYWPRRPVLANLHVPVPVGCVPGGPSYVTNGSRAQRVIALTFDDGPWYDTPQFLNVLEQKHVPATFFWIGEQVQTYGPAVYRRILGDGDIIGDHTWNHADVAGGGSFAFGEIASAASAIRSLTGFSPCLFRAPGGAVGPGLISLARSMGFITIEWDVDPRDWSRPGTGAIYSTVVGNAFSGSIVLQHDGGGDRSETLAALPGEIDTLRARGYSFVTIPQLLGLRVIYK